MIKPNFQLHIHGKYFSYNCADVFSSYEVELPEYESKEILREKILMAIFEGIDGFHIG